MSLTEGLRAGAPEVYGLLYDTYAGRLHAYCAAMVGDEAAEAVRDTFIAAARHPGTVTGDEALPVWLYALARAECVRRGAPVRKTPVEPAAEPLRRALARLRIEHREVLVLAGALDTTEIARVVGVAPDTAEQLLRVARRRLDQAAASVLGGRAARDDDMLTALGAGRLHKLVARPDEPPARLRERVLFSCAAAERAVDGALLFDQDGMPIPLDGLFSRTDEVTRPMKKVDASDPALAPPKKDDVVVARSAKSSRAKKEPFLTRRRDGLAELLGLAACAAVAAGVLVLWPSSDGHGASNMDGTSLLLHRGSPVSRLLQPSPAGTSSHVAGASRPGAPPSTTPAPASTAPSATSASPSAPAGASPSAAPTTITAVASPAHPTAQPSTPPSSTPTLTPTDSTPSPRGSESSSPTVTPTPDPSTS